jgi:cytochrome subunit of sulfide dehydrogenase
MTLRAAMVIACALAGIPAAAQQPAPPAPAFAAPNLAGKGVESMAAACAACHGTRGKLAQGSTVPSIAGRPRDELVQVMGQFRAGQRPATIMHQIAKGYGDAEIAALADYFSKQPR